MATNVKILLRRGLRSALSANGLDAGELGYTTDSKQLYVGTAPTDDEIIFDPFANAQSIVQTYLNLSVASGGPTEQGLEIDEDLIIREVSDVADLLNDMQTYGIITAGSFEPTKSVTAGAFRPISTAVAMNFVIGTEYTIATVGTTDFTLIGAANNNVGTVFTATGVGTGTGTATYGTSYTIATVDDGLGGATTDFTLIGAADNNIGTVFKATGIGTETYTAGSFVVGREYTILTTGTTDFTLIGATDSNIGTVFTSTGVGTGTGTANFLGTGTATYGKEYKIKTTGTTDFTLIGLPNNNITSGSFVIGTKYKIVTVGTTDFTLIGAPDNNVGTIFTATGVGTGTGTATTIGAVGEIFTATGVGAGTGTAIDTYDHFYSNIFASERKNVEVLTENSFSQVYANMHLQTHTSADGRRPSLFKKDLATTSGTFLKYAKTDSTSFFIDYSLKQVGTSDTFIRVGRLQVVNGAAVTPAIAQAKLTDNNTEIWQDTGITLATAGSLVIGTSYEIVTVGTTDFTLIGATDNDVGTKFVATGPGVGTGTVTYGDGIAQSDEFSNIEFTSVIDGDNLKINYTQDANFTTEISYTVKRWTM